MTHSQIENRILLGMDWLQAHNPRIYWRTRTLSLAGRVNKYTDATTIIEAGIFDQAFLDLLDDFLWRRKGFLIEKTLARIRTVAQGGAQAYFRGHFVISVDNRIIMVGWEFFTLSLSWRHWTLRNSLSE